MPTNAHPSPWLLTSPLHGLLRSLALLFHQRRVLTMAWLRLFLQRGADVNHLSSKGDRPLHSASALGNTAVAKYFVSLCGYVSSLRRVADC